MNSPETEYPPTLDFLVIRASVLQLMTLKNINRIGLHRKYAQSKKSIGQKMRTFKTSNFSQGNASWHPNGP